MIDEIIRFCEYKYRISPTYKSRLKYEKFLKREFKSQEYHIDDIAIDTETGKPSNNFNLMADKLMLFSYLTGDTEIETKNNGGTKKVNIKHIDGLYVLRPLQFGASAPSYHEREGINY